MAYCRIRVPRLKARSMKSGGYFLPVKAEVRRKAQIGAGDEVTVSLELL
jgi:hypothetical protein